MNNQGPTVAKEKTLQPTQLWVTQARGHLTIGPTRKWVIAGRWLIDAADWLVLAWVTVGLIVTPGYTILYGHGTGFDYLW